MKNNVDTWKQVFYSVMVRTPFFMVEMAIISYFAVFNIGYYFYGKMDELTIIVKDTKKDELTLIDRANDTVIFKTNEVYKYKIGGTLYLKTVIFNSPFHYSKKRIVEVGNSYSAFYTTLFVIICFIYYLFEPVIDVFLDILEKKIKKAKNLP